MKTTIVLDAVRTKDGAFVVIKSLKKSIFSEEINIGRFLSSPPLASDPRNCCCPALDAFDDPYDSDLQLLVMPLLRSHYEPKFATVGEVVEFCRQLFEVRPISAMVVAAPSLIRSPL